MRLLRNRKAISPIFATLILIAIAVIAGIIVYMFTSGTLAAMLGGGTAGQEKVAVEAVQPAISSAVVWAKSTGGTDVPIDAAIIKTSGGTTIAVVTVATTLPADGTLTDITVADAALTAGDVFTITLTSVSGGSFVSSSFQVPLT